MGELARTPRLFARSLLPGCRHWCAAKDGDPSGWVLARRHYSALKNKRPKLRLFVGPGEKYVLISPWEDAVFVWRVFIDDCEYGVNCSIFRKEGPGVASEMIQEAMALAWARWPGARLYTYVDPSRVRSQNPGWCFICAGWSRCGVTKSGLLVFEVLPA